MKPNTDKSKLLIDHFPDFKQTREFEIGDDIDHYFKTHYKILEELKIVLIGPYERLERFLAIRREDNKEFIITAYCEFVYDLAIRVSEMEINQNDLANLQLSR